MQVPGIPDSSVVQTSDCYTFWREAASYYDVRVAGLGKCANPGCEAEFKRLGTGKIYTSPVEQPQVWGLPPHVRQKVVWLCAKCAVSHKVIFDQQRCQVLVIDHERVHKRSA